MNLYELDKLIERVKDDKELHEFYTKKRAELVEKIKQAVIKKLITN